MFRNTAKLDFLMHTTRRRFIRLRASVDRPRAILNRALLNAASQRIRIPIGFQLYSARGDFCARVQKELKMRGEIAYRGPSSFGASWPFRFPSDSRFIIQKYFRHHMRKLLDDAAYVWAMHLDLKALAKEI